MFWETIAPVEQVIRKGTLRAEPSPGRKAPPQRDSAPSSICGRACTWRRAFERVRVRVRVRVHMCVCMCICVCMCMCVCMCVCMC